MTQVQLFDKIINISLFRSTPGIGVAGAGAANKAGSYASVTCPPTGRKPTIRLSGEMVSTFTLTRLELRITNFETDVPLSQYTMANGGHSSVVAGYAGSLKGAFYGEILNAYQELPGPDGVTMFEFLVGSFYNWTTKTIKVNYGGGVPLRSVLSDVAGALGLSLLYYADARLVTPFNGIHHNGLAKDLLLKIMKMFRSQGYNGDWSGLMLRPDGQNLIATNRDLGTGLTYQLDYVSMVNHTAAGFEIQAPWVPSIRPDDYIQIDPRYFRQGIGGAFVAVQGTIFQVIRVSFDFCTTDSTNMMTLTTVDRASIPQIHAPSIPMQKVVG